MRPRCYYCDSKLEIPCDPCPDCHKFLCVDCDIVNPEECRACQDGLYSDSCDSDDDYDSSFIHDS